MLQGSLKQTHKHDTLVSTYHLKHVANTVFQLALRPKSVQKAKVVLAEMHGA